MSDFGVYLKLGFEHITDLNGFDHMLFLLALCASYSLRDLRRVLILVTAFTLGHSLTLFLSVRADRILEPNLVETLILLSIVTAAVLNLVRPPSPNKKPGLNTCWASFFGLIHGSWIFETTPAHCWAGKKASSSPSWPSILVWNSDRFWW